MSAFVAGESSPTRSPSGHRGLWWRVALLLLMVIAFVLVLITFLNYSNYRKVQLELNLTRHLVLGKDLRQTVETGLNVGLTPSENTRIDPAMTEVAERQPGTRYIAIVDETGVIVSKGDLPLHAAEGWKSQLAATASGEYWQSSHADTYQVGLPFSNSFNLKSGAVVIGYDKGTIEAASSEMLSKLCIDMLKTLCVFALLTLGGTFLLTRKLSNELGVVEASIDCADKDAASARMANAVLGPDITEDINHFEKLSRRAVHLIAGLDAEIRAAPASPAVHQEDKT